MNHRHAWRLAISAAILVAAIDAAVAQAPAQVPGIDTGAFDRSVRPQDDFYAYVNGGWLKQTELPADRAYVGTFVNLADESEAALRVILEEAAATPNRAPGSDAQKLADLYLAFMDSAALDRQGLEPLREPLGIIASLRERGDLAETFADLRDIGVQLPFSIGVSQDQKRAERYIAVVYQSGLGLPDRDYYLQESERFADTRAKYRAYIETLLRLAGQADPAGAATRILALENAIAGKHWDRVKNRDDELTYNLKTVSELDALMPAFDWGEFLDEIDAEGTPGVVVSQPDYLQALDQLITDTPLGTWREYLTFKLLDAFSPYLAQPFVDARFELRGKALAGLKENRPRWKRAITLVESSLGEIAGRQYVERHFAPSAKTRMQELVTNLLGAFREGIEGLEWMSPETKAQAQAKLASFNVKIGYPDQWRDYSGLEIRSGDLVGNIMRSTRLERRRDVERLGKPIDRAEWLMTPQTVNAYYLPTMNEIVFPAAILRAPMFNPAADDAVNYGAIGSVIGHEISHGFDDQGRRSNGEGNLQNWWTPQDSAAFQRRADGLIAQYDSLTLGPDLKVNGRLTLGENIGDVSGITVAYQAYRRSLGGREAPVIGGLTGDQRFFLGYAQAWKSKMRDELQRQLLLSDTHSPDRFRVNAVLRNVPEFYAAFDVRPGDGMYLPPEQRVKIW